MTEHEDDFTAFVQQEWAGLYRSAYLLVGDHGLAEDLAQSALARTFTAWSRVRDADSPRAYVRATLTNVAGSWFRRRGWNNEVATETLPEQAVEAAPSGDHDVMAALDLLPRGQRAVVVLRFHEDLSVAETAHLLDLSEGTVKSQTSHALAKLRHLLSSPAAVSAGLVEGNPS